MLVQQVEQDRVTFERRAVQQVGILRREVRLDEVTGLEVQAVSLDALRQLGWKHGAQLPGRVLGRGEDAADQRIVWRAHGHVCAPSMS